MRVHSQLRKLNAWHVGLAALAIMASVVAGGSYLVYPSPSSPLMVGGVIATVAIGIAWLRKPVWALYAAIFVVLFPEGLIPEHIHSILNRSTLLIALGVWLLDAAARRRRIVWTGTAMLMLGFLLWGTVTLFWTPNLDLGTQRVIQYALRLILFLLLVVNEVDTRDALDGLMRTLALSGWVLLLAGAGTVLFGGYEPGTQLLVLGMNPNQFGISLIVTMPGVLWPAMSASRRRKALAMPLSVMFVLLAFILIALSGSRGSAISLLITMLAFWFWKPTRSWGKVGLLILAVTAVSAPFIFSTTLERFVEQASGILGGRIPIWQASLMLIRDHVLGGVGIGNAPYEVIPYYSRLVGLFPPPPSRAIHSPVLAIWAETGVPGLLLYLAVLGSAVRIFVREVRRHRGTGFSSLASYFALVSSVFIGFMFSWIKGGGMEYHRTYFLMLALMLIPAHLEFDRKRHMRRMMLREPR